MSFFVSGEPKQLTKLQQLFHNAVHIRELKMLRTSWNCCVK